jgi:hypothetical protein
MGVMEKRHEGSKALNCTKKGDPTRGADIGTAFESMIFWDILT